MDLDLLRTRLKDLGQPAFRVRQVEHAVTRDLVGSWEEITTLPAKLRAQLAQEVPFSTLVIDHVERSADGSAKLRLLTHDGYPIESVLMRFDRPHEGVKGLTGRYTACLSSQSGCALSCTFCATGKMKLGRSLTRWEILDQFLTLLRLRKEGMRKGLDRRDDDLARIDNVVMMGMGEPFHNYDEVLAACRLMNDPDGTNLAARRIAISTVGWVPGIDRLADEDIQVKLALSLHAPNNEVRATLMPVTKKYPVERLMQSIRRYRDRTNRRVFIEYLMLDGVNDQPRHAHELAELLGPEGFHVNLIAYNPTETDYVGSSDAVVRRFAQILESHKVHASYRVSRGRDISAACGQLAAPLEQLRRQKRAERLAASKQREHAGSSN
jgi:23S rRNA (adenine2503-C2)-methyltransferase